MSDAAPPPSPTPEALVDELRRLLDVEMLDTDCFRGMRQPGGRGRVFGGQVVAQALAAAMRTIDGGRIAHSLHAYFMRGGDEREPILYRVARDFNGRSFATRRVVAIQHDRPILTLTCSFQVPEQGLEHAATMPDVPPPEALVDDRTMLAPEIAQLPPDLAASLGRKRPIELRSVEPRSLLHPPKTTAAAYAGWFRVVAPAGDDAAFHQSVIAYASDMMLLAASMRPHGVSVASAAMQVASLDHAVWFHAAARVDDWLLYVVDSPWAGGGRGFTRGRIYERGGRLVASTAQEGLIRSREDRR